MRKRRAIFACNPESGEPSLYCGHTDDMDGLKLGITNLAMGELGDLFERGNLGLNGVTLQFSALMMTDKQIAELPDAG